MRGSYGQVSNVRKAFLAWRSKLRRGLVVAVGEPVQFHAVVEVPPGAGTSSTRSGIFEGAGDYPVGGPRFDGSETRVSFETTCAFSEPGTYFPALRVTSQRQGEVDSPFARVQNLGRVRVVVS